MKKTWWIAILALAVIVIATAFFFLKGEKKTIENEVVGEEEKVSEDKETQKGLLEFMSIRGGIKCSVEDKDGKYVVYSNGSKVKLEGIDYVGYGTESAEPQKGFMINDGTWSYIWGGKEGIKFNMKEMGEFSGDTQDNESFKASDWTDWAKSMEESGAKYDCGPTVVSDADFTPPSDVVFQDMGEVFKQFQNMGNQLQNIQIPNIGQ